MYGPRMRAAYDLGRGDGVVGLELGPFHDEPAAVKAYARWFSDNCVRSFLCSPYPVIESVEADSLKGFFSKPDEMFWPIHANGGLIGTTSLFDIDRNHRKAELGIVIGESDWWGRGVATISEMLLSGYAFSNIVAGGLNKVTARVLDGNDGSRGALDKAGFHQIATLREDHWARGRWFDVHLYESLADDWRAAREERLAAVGVTEFDLYPGCRD